MRDDTNKNTEEAVVETTVEETTDMQTKTDELQNAEEAVVETTVEKEEPLAEWLDWGKSSKPPLDWDKLNKTPVEQEESLLDWVDSVIAENQIGFDVWIPGGNESPVLCIRAIRGNKVVSGTARVNVANRNRRSVSIAIQSVIKEVIQK